MGRRLVTGPLVFFGFCKGISVPSPMNHDMLALSATLWLMMSAATMDSCDVPYFSNSQGTLSGPQAFPFLSCFIAVSTSAGDTATLSR